MKRILRSIISQSTINNFYHLPKAIIASLIYGFPTRKLKVIGITGTDGKTTTTGMVYQVLKDAGKKVSMVSTVNAVIGGKYYDTGFHVTSPDPFSIQKYAKLARNNGDEYLVLEVTSHGLDQYRFWGIKFDVAVLTNISHEHLDYHKTFENYKNTKLKLFQDTKFKIINQGNKGDVGNRGDKVITFGLNEGDFNQKEVKLNLKIPGDYNIENALAALACAFALHIDKKTAQKTLENFEGVKGRMEEVKNNRGIKIIIDFAHTPNGLESVLKTLKLQVGESRIIAIIGAEGFRDPGKRAMMGEIAQKLSNVVIVTSVDPRGQLEIINRQIMEGAKKAGAKKDINFFVIDDRKKAIDFSINTLARKGDIIGVFGKGCETSMNLDGKKEIPWSDFDVVKGILNG